MAALKVGTLSGFPGLFLVWWHFSFQVKNSSLVMKSGTEPFQDFI